MSDKVTHGGQREGAGRPQKTAFEPMEQPQTPLMRHWQELARRYGQEASDEMRLQFNAWHQEYQKAQQQKNRQRIVNERIAAQKKLSET